jgi:sterol desaturase/sphingolipid hydroxylase (fatty acid hydroxylase superfamily)
LNLIDFKELLLIALIFVPLERLFALRPEQKILRDGWVVDLTHLFATGLLIKLGLGFVLAAMILGVERVVPVDWRAAVAAQPHWLQFMELLLLADLGFYLAHRAFHAVPCLWRIHSVHHSIEAMDWLAAHRVHPIDQIVTKSASFLPVFALGFAIEPILVFALLYQWQSLLIHANTRIGYGPLRWILASPRFHHWHHANHVEAHGKNFAGQVPLWDLCFGTLYMPRHAPERYGIDDPMPRSYLGQIAYPFVRRGEAEALPARDRAPAPT